MFPKGSVQDGVVEVHSEEDDWRRFRLEESGGDSDLDVIGR